jgi:hypothetical protein
MASVMILADLQLENRDSQHQLPRRLRRGPRPDSHGRKPPAGPRVVRMQPIVIAKVRYGQRRGSLLPQLLQYARRRHRHGHERKHQPWEPAQRQMPPNVGSGHASSPLPRPSRLPTLSTTPYLLLLANYKHLELSRHD